MSSLIKSLFRLMVVSLMFAMLMPITTTRANPDCTDPKHAGNPNCPPPDDPPAPSVTYTAELTGRVFQFGSFPVTPNGKENALFPDPSMEFTFTRPDNGDPLAQDAWDAVLAACENFFGPNPIYMGPTVMVVSEFTVPAGNLEIHKSGGVLFGMGSIPFDITGNSPPDPNEGGLYATVSVDLFGNTFFDNPNDSFLPGAGGTEQYPEVKFWITGGTAKRVRPRGGCVSGGSAPITDFDTGFESTLVITATAQ